MAVDGLLGGLERSDEGMRAGERGEHGEDGGRDGVEVLVEQLVRIRLGWRDRNGVAGECGAMGLGEEAKGTERLGCEIDGYCEVYELMLVGCFLGEKGGTNRQRRCECC